MELRMSALSDQSEFPERIQIGLWDDGRFAGPFDADMKNGRPDLTTAVYVRVDLVKPASDEEER
jgi:hypothetical protein